MIPFFKITPEAAERMRLNNSKGGFRSKSARIIEKKKGHLWYWKLVGWFDELIAEGFGGPGHKGRQAARDQAKSAKQAYTSKFEAEIEKRRKALIPKIESGGPGWKKAAAEHAKLGEVKKHLPK